MDEPGPAWTVDHYAQGTEAGRLSTAAGQLEFLRTTEILLRHLPAPPVRVADIGAGPGAYSQWLAGRGHRVVARDLVPLHVAQLREAARVEGLDVEAAVGDARALDLPDAGMDAVLLLGPIYHLTTREARLRCLAEAARIVRPGGVVAVAAISRWAVLLDGVLKLRLREGDPAFAPLLDQAVDTGVLAPFTPGGFSAYVHRPEELRGEVESAGLEVLTLEAVEGAGAYLPDLEERWSEPAAREAVLGVARRCAAAPEMLGVGSHLLAVATKPP